MTGLGAAARLGAQVMMLLNLAPAKQMPASLLAQLDYLILNESEATLLTEIAVSDVSSARQAAQALRQMGCGTVIVTLGEKGALLSHADGEKHVSGFAVDVVDTTAAGDAFVGAFAVAVTEGKSLAEAVRFANAVGALTVTKLGAQPSLPRLAEVERLVGKVS